MLPSRRQFVVLLICGTLPIMTTASLAPILPGLHQAFAQVEGIDWLSRLVLTAPALAIALGAWLLGYGLDKLGRRSVLAVSLMIYAATGAVGLWAEDLTSLVTARFIFGLAVAGIMTATATLMVDFFPPLALRSKMALQAGVMGAWGILAQSSSGLLAEYSWRYPFALYLIALPLVPCVLFWLPEPLVEDAAIKADRREAEPLSWEAQILSVFSFAAMGLYVMVPIQASFYFSHELHLRPRSTALLLCILTGASSLTSLGLAWHRKRWSRALVLSLGFLVMGAGFAAFAYWTRRLGLALGMMAVGAGIGSIAPCVSSSVAELSSPAYRGRAMGRLTTMNYLGQFFVPLASQEVLVLFGYQGLFYRAAILALGLGILVVGVGKNRSQSPAEG